jgi:hypothetical protein
MNTKQTKSIGVRLTYAEIDLIKGEMGSDTTVAGWCKAVILQKLHDNDGLDLPKASASMARIATRLRKERVQREREKMANADVD